MIKGCGLSLLELLCCSEVTQDQVPPLIEQEVARLQVSMYDSLASEVVKYINYRGDIKPSLLQREAPYRLISTKFTI